MRVSLRASVPLALVITAVASPPAFAGGAVADPIYPSVVQERIDRTERALERATKQMDNGNLAKATVSLKVVRRQLSSAWRGAKYVIRTAPPPVATDSSVRAHAAGGAPAGGSYAAPPDTGFRVLTLHHEVVAGMTQLIDGAHGLGLAPLSTTLNFALDRRDQAVRDILALAPPAPPVATDSSVRAHAAGGAVTATFDAVMPNVPPQLDDETQAIDATLEDATDLTAGGRRLLQDAETQITATKAFVTTTWPPLPADD